MSARPPAPTRSTRFVRVAQEDWRFGAHLGRRQKERLLSRVTYEQIIARIVRETRVVRHWRERARSKPKFFRVRVTVRVKSSTVDLFHNSVSGYRAQYYRSSKTGDRANAYALKRIARQITELLRDHTKRTCALWWVQRSLLDRDAKLWIRQRRWFRYGKRADRHLLVARWVKQQTRSNGEQRRKALWAGLTPNEETEIEIKGGFLTLSGKPLGTLKRERARDIHKLGFT